MSRNKRLISILSIIGVLVVGAAAMLILSSFSSQAAESEPGDDTRIVRTMELRPDSHQLWVEGDGFLQASRSIVLHIPLSGQIRFAYKNLQGGVRVEESDLLLALDARRAENTFEAARYNFIRLASTFITQAGLEGSERSAWESLIARLKQTVPSDNLALGQLPATNGRARVLASSLGVLEAWYALDRAAMDYSDHFLRAPFSGSLIGDGVQAGSWISPGQVLARISDTATLEIPVSLPVSDIQQLSEGAAAEIHQGDRLLTGVLERIEPSLSSASQTGRVFVSAVNDTEDPLFPGAFVRVRIEGAEIPEGYRIPRNLLISNSLPVLEEGVLALKPVRILGYQDDDVIIAADFPAGTRVITTVIQAPIEGMALRSEENVE